MGLGQGAEIGAAVFLELSGQTHVPTHDQNGNVTALFLPSGECLETYRYTAFGEELASTNLSNPWRFSSKRYDPETGFLYFGQRYYAADLGRWITPDPLEFEDGPNLYAYVHNNPLTSIDLYGLFDGVEDYDFADRNSYSDFVAYPLLGQGIGNAAYNYCFGSLGGATQNNVVPIDEEKDDWRNTFSQDCERWANHAMPTAVDLAKDWAIGAVLGATLTVGAPFVAAGVTTIGAYKYGPKIVNAVVSGARKIVGCRKGAQYFNKSEKIASNGAESVNAGILLRRRLISEEIAGGHAFDKHALEFGFKTQEQMASHINEVLTNPTMSRELLRGRSAYWHEKSGTIVIRNPTAIDGGTAFIPDTGVNYFKTSLR